MRHLVCKSSSFFFDFSFISNVFIKNHEYLNYISLTTIYMVRFLCLSFTVLQCIKFGTLGHLSSEI